MARRLRLLADVSQIRDHRLHAGGDLEFLNGGFDRIIASASAKAMSWLKQFQFARCTG